MADKAVEKRSGAEVSKVDPADEPSAEWGWHGGFPRATRVAGVVSIIVLLLMLLFTRDHVWEARAWLWAFVATIVVGLFLDFRKRRRAWRQ